MRADAAARRADGTRFSLARHNYSFCNFLQFVCRDRSSDEIWLATCDLPDEWLWRVSTQQKCVSRVGGLVVLCAALLESAMEATAEHGAARALRWAPSSEEAVGENLLQVRTLLHIGLYFQSLAAMRHPKFGILVGGSILLLLATRTLDAIYPFFLGSD